MLCYMNGLEFNQNTSNRQCALHILTMRFVSPVAFIPLVCASGGFMLLWLTNQQVEENLCVPVVFARRRVSSTCSHSNLSHSIRGHKELGPSRADALSLHWGTTGPSVTVVDMLSLPFSPSMSAHKGTRPTLLILKLKVYLGGGERGLCTGVAAWQVNQRGFGAHAC